MSDTSCLLEAQVGPDFEVQTRKVSGAPTWPNGFDISLEWLRREMAAAGELTQVAAE